MENKVERRKRGLDRRVSNFCDASYKETKSQFIAEFEKRYLSWLMSETNGNVTHAAQRVGKERRALGKLLKKYNIDKTRFQLSSKESKLKENKNRCTLCDRLVRR
jgi:DNA-binding NtrC family response regulator